MRITAHDFETVETSIVAGLFLCKVIFLDSNQLSSYNGTKLSEVSADCNKEVR